MSVDKYLADCHRELQAARAELAESKEAYAEHLRFTAELVRLMAQALESGQLGSLSGILDDLHQR